MVADYMEKNRSRFVSDLRDLIRIPSVSAVPAHREDVARCARWLAGHLENMGMSVGIHPTPGHPIVYAEWLKAPDRPTVLIYGHYDVQPVDPLNLWRHDPFEGAIEGENLVARGATDDKGQVFAHVKAIESHMKSAGKLPVNVKLIIEGEEEVGSENLDAWIADNRERLSCDVIVISDTAQFGPGVPAITYGLRGIAYFELRVDGPDRDLHSGVYGGAVDNPANVLAQILAGLKDEEGRIRIEGFYDSVRPLTAEERKGFVDLSLDEAEFCRSIGIPRSTGEAGYTTLERRWARPTCDVNGLYGGYQGEGSKTVLPAWAGAKVSFRLVPDQDPAEIATLFRKHIEKVTPSTVRVTLSDLHGGRPVLVPMEGEAMDAARRAMTRGFGTPPVMIREGGSIPVVSTFQEILRAPVLLLGFGRNDDNAHSPNEKFSLNDYHHGIRTAAFLLEELAATTGAALRS
jgi:acetylornithine deacetylase/succinyl-diaminopimelate desuccinylase-like protein